MRSLRYSKVYGNWLQEQLEYEKRKSAKFHEWLQATHPEVLKEYDNYILGKILCVKVLRVDEARELVSDAAKASEIFGDDALEEHAKKIKGGL